MAKKRQLDMFIGNPDRLSTGTFGIPGNISGAVHIVQRGKPVCGTRMSKYAIFQWCSHGIYEEWIECRRCLAWNEKRQA